MDYLQYGQVDHPHRNYGRGEDDYPPPSFNLSPYSTPIEEPAYGGGRAYGPPPSYASTYEAPPPRDYHTSSYPPYMESQNYSAPPPPPPSSYVDNYRENNPYLRPPHGDGMLGFIEEKLPHHGTNNYVVDGVEPRLGLLANKPTNSIYCKAGGGRFVVAIRDGKVILTHPNPGDPTQHWYKDEKYSTKVKDEELHPSFILVNKATGQAIKHSVAGYPVQLVPYKPDVFDESILWTESKDMGYGFRTIRTVNNISLVMDAFHGDKDHGGVHDGTIVALYKCWKGDNQNQQWKTVPY